MRDSGRQRPTTGAVDPVKKVQEWITQALRLSASDIHVEPRESKVAVRVRVDGDLQLLDELPASAHASIIARIKIMAAIDINERRKPQDGRICFDKFSQRVQGLDLRVNVNPTLFGEKAVLRLIDNTKLKYTLEDMGFSAQNLIRYRACIQRPHGLILHVGPTGSGKTTTLYSALQEIRSPKRNLNTVEDPIEYTCDGISQTQVNHDIGLTFPVILRALLRQDPDVIMVGEIRDLETAEIALEAAMTGHLILSTLHTNDAVGTIARLQDMGIANFYIAYALACVVSQRFVRKLCRCKKTERPPGSILADLPERVQPDFYRPEGCFRCNETGYKGRTAVMEVLTLDAALKKAIHENAPTHDLFDLAVRAGMTSLYQDALLKAANGVTSLAEALRVSQADEKDQKQRTTSPQSSPAPAPAPAPAPRSTQRRVVVRKPSSSERRTRVRSPDEEHGGRRA